MATRNNLRTNVIKLARCDEDLNRLQPDQAGQLFDIIWNLHEAFDGEDVDAPYIVRLMAIRYVRKGLTPLPGDVT